MGVIHLFNLYLPLILKGKDKKVIVLSSGMADLDMVAKHNLAIGGPYSITKAAMNLAVAKYSAEYSKDGVLFLSLSPGAVDTNHNVGDRKLNDPAWEYDLSKNLIVAIVNEETLGNMQHMFALFNQLYPNFTERTTPESSVQDMLNVIDKASVADGYGGTFISHKGNQEWL